MFNTQILTILGLTCEALSSIWIVRRLFYGYYERIEKRGSSLKNEERRDKIDGSIVLTLLGLGMFLQIIAVI